MKSSILYPYGKQTITKDDIQTVVKVLNAPFLTQGPIIRQFEKKICMYTGAKYAVAVSSATAGLHLACLAAGVTSKDEGITSPITFVASANCVSYCGGTVRFADVDPSTGLINPQEIEKQITKRTKVIIPVHYAGQSSNMEEIYRIAKKHNCIVIEDAAHAIGSEYRGTKVGSCRYSDMTVFSFHPVKTITTGEGGVVTTNQKHLYETLISLRSHGITKDPKKFIHRDQADQSWRYEMRELGFNYRMTDIQAALGISQLSKLSRFSKKRQQLVKYYDEFFSDNPIIQPLKSVSYGHSCRHLYVLRINFSKLDIKREELMDKLKQKGIGTQVHYIPVYQHPWYEEKTKHMCLHAEYFYNQCISLPLYPSLTLKDLQKITVIFKEIIDSHDIVNTVIIKKACISDMRDVYMIRNDRQVRTNAFHSEFIAWEKHKEWYAAKMKDVKSFFFVCKTKKEKKIIGYIRYDWEAKEKGFIITIHIASPYRNIGVGKKLVKNTIGKLNANKNNYLRFQ